MARAPPQQGECYPCISVSSEERGESLTTQELSVDPLVADFLSHAASGAPTNKIQYTAASISGKRCPIYPHASCRSRIGGLLFWLPLLHVTDLNRFSV